MFVFVGVLLVLTLKRVDLALRNTNTLLKEAEEMKMSLLFLQMNGALLDQGLESLWWMDSYYYCKSLLGSTRLCQMDLYEIIPRACIWELAIARETF